MGDFLGLVVIVLYFILSASSSKKKKAERARANAPREHTGRSIQFEQAFEREPLSRSEQLSRQKEAVYEGSIGATGMHLEPFGEGDEPCHEEMLGHDRAALRARTVSQQQMAAAGEGEDPCHVGGYAVETTFDDELTMENSPIFDTEDPDAFARDILRGVIMSEILTRPQDRRRCAGMKRGA